MKTVLTVSLLSLALASGPAFAQSTQPADRNSKYESVGPAFADHPAQHQTSDPIAIMASGS